MRYGINTKLTAMFVIGVLAAFMLQLWSFWALSTIESSSSELHTMYRRLELTQHLNYHTHRLLRISSEYILTKDQKKRDAFDAILKETAATLHDIDELPPSQMWDDVAVKVKNDVRELSEITIDVVYSDSPMKNDVVSAIMKRGATLADEITASIESFHDRLLKDVKVKREYAEKETKRMKLVVYVFLLAGTVIIIVLYFSLKSRVTEPIDELYKGAKRLTRGDYVHDIQVKTGDELEHLAEAMNKMAGTLKEREEKLFTLLKVVDKINMDLITANRHKSDFLAHVNHELKTPLTHVLGFSDLLSMEMEKSMSPSAQAYLTNIKKGGKELLRIIESLLTVAKSGEGMSFELKEVSPAGVVNELLQELIPSARAKKQIVHVDVAPDISPGKLDVPMFKQIVANLFENAVKFTPQGGTIRLEMSDFMTDKGQRRLKIAVVDDGIGIDDELKNVLFNPFMIGESGLVREHGGIGMGLTLTKRFVEFHNGTISVKSEPGKGARFDVEISI